MKCWWALGAAGGSGFRDDVAGGGRLVGSGVFWCSAHDLPTLRGAVGELDLVLVHARVRKGKVRRERVRRVGMRRYGPSVPTSREEPAAKPVWERGARVKFHYTQPTSPN